MIEIKRYYEGDKELWDNFVHLSKNGCFLFFRSFMDYHKERFIDHSLMIYSDSKLVSVLPANESGAAIYSHAGLTFGGLITDHKMKGALMLEVFNEISSYYSHKGFATLFYKSMPSIFHKMPSCEDLYVLFRLGATLIRRDLSSAVALTNIPKYNKGRKWVIKKAKTSGVYVKESIDISVFYNLLQSALEKHGAKPVHTIQELELLMSRFSSNIKLYIAYSDCNVPLAGALIFDYGRVVHTQYLATSDAGKDLGALDLIIHELISEIYKEREYFSFGISTENNGRDLNEGLLAQKEGFGARSITHDLYEVSLGG